MLEITPSKLQDLISKIHFSNDGDGYEQTCWGVFEKHFPNLELFWRKFIVPTTRRVESPAGGVNRILRRDDIDDGLWDITFHHYSLFLHLIYAYEHMRLPLASSFGDFYAHLVSASDLAHDFLIKTYILTSECRGNKSHLMQELPRDEFLSRASEWYDSRYAKAHEHYVAKGKWPSIKVPTRESFVGEYVGDVPGWKDYQKFDISLRTSRNVLIHSTAMGEVQVLGNGTLVPRRQRIEDYKTLSSIFDAARYSNKVRTDFILKQDQMSKDFPEMQAHLNALWEKPLADFDTLFFQEHNEQLCRKYHVRLMPE